MPPIMLVRTASGELSSLCMMKLTHSAVEGLQPLDRSPAELALLRSLIPPLILLVADATQPAPHMLACALWGMARIRALRGPLVAAGAVAALTGVADRLLNEAKAKAKVDLQAAQASLVELAAQVEDARKKSVAAGLHPEEVAEAVAAVAEEAKVAAAAAAEAATERTGASEYGGSVPGMLLEWSIAALWTLCTLPPEEAAASAANMTRVREGRLAEARAQLSGAAAPAAPAAPAAREPAPEPTASAPEPAAPAPAAAPTRPPDPRPGMGGPPRRGMLRKEQTSADGSSRFNDAMKEVASISAARDAPGAKAAPKTKPDALAELHSCGGVGVVLHWLARGPDAASPCARTLLVEVMLVAARCLA